MHTERNTLFSLQSELLDKKVEVAVNNNIIAFHQELANLRNEMVSFKHEIRHDMHELRFELGTRLTAVETALGMRLKKQEEVRSRFLDYSFKAGWIVIFAIVSGLASSLPEYLHKLVK
jgi:hypothetical protein